MRKIRVACLTALCVVTVQITAQSQAPAAPSGPQHGWDVAVYPILGWVPLVNIGVDIPPFDGASGGSGNIVDTRFDGAFLGGVAASNGTWRLEVDGMWTGLGGDRSERLHLTVDLDLVYGHAILGRRVVPGLYLTAGVRPLAFKYDITLGDLPHFSRKRGVWNPLVGIRWQNTGAKFDWHVSFEGGGFSVGADVDLAGTIRMDWKPVRHFGVTGGYSVLYLKVTDTVAGRTVIVKPTVHGPVLGIGLYF